MWLGCNMLFGGFRTRGCGYRDEAGTGRDDRLGVGRVVSTEEAKQIEKESGNKIMPTRRVVSLKGDGRTRCRLVCKDFKSAGLSSFREELYSGSDRHWSEQANVQIPTCRRCFGVCSHAQAPKWSWLEPPPLVAGGIFQPAVKAIRKLIFLVSQEMREENVSKASINVLQVYYHPESVTYEPSIWSLRLANPKHPDPMVCIPNLLSYQPKQTGDHTANNTSNRVYLSPSLRT